MQKNLKSLILIRSKTLTDILTDNGVTIFMNNIWRIYILYFRQFIICNFNMIHPPIGLSIKTVTQKYKIVGFSYLNKCQCEEKIAMYSILGYMMLII